MPTLTSVKDFVAGGAVRAADVDDVNCGVKVFAGTAARDAAYGGAGERTLEEGEVCYLQSTKQLLKYNGTAWVTW